MNEDRLLKDLGIPETERRQIEGLYFRRSTSTKVFDAAGPVLTEEQLTPRAVARLATNPPPGIGKMQRRTSKYLLRPYPLGTPCNIEPETARLHSCPTFCCPLRFEVQRQEYDPLAWLAQRGTEPLHEHDQM
jgi:hypothetical protein|eukprot:1785443-Prymnesium_polylepis.1